MKYVSRRDSRTVKCECGTPFCLGEGKLCDCVEAEPEDLEPTADFFAKEFSVDENIKLAQICVAAEYENDLKAMDGKIKAMNHLEAAMIQVANGVDTL